MSALLTKTSKKAQTGRSVDSKTVGQYLLERLAQEGVGHIFGIPGDYVLRFDKVIEESAIKYINTTRENTAGYMADAYGRLNGLGVACITYGVGINIVNAMAQAYVENSPLLVISGAASKSEYDKSPLRHHLINTAIGRSRDLTQCGILSHVTVDSAVLDDPDTAQETIDRLVDNCKKLQKPVYLELPRDMVDQPITVKERHVVPRLQSDPEALAEAIQEIQKILKEAKRPFIWAGHEIARYGLQQQLLTFAERYNIPMATTLLGKGTFSERHPLFCGVYQKTLSLPEVSQFIEGCDSAIMLGVLLSDVNTGIFSAPLSYSQRVAATYEGVTVNHHHYRNVYLPDFVEALSKLNLNVRYRIDFPACIDRPVVSFEPRQDAKTTMSRLLECIQKHFKASNILVTDIGDCLWGCSDIIVERSAFLACAYFASLGFGVPAAIAAQLNAPDKRVIAVVGDGAFQMTSMELSTAVRYGLDPIIIVLNNHGYGTERPLIEGEFNDIVDWRYYELPRVLGSGMGVRVTNEIELEEALEAALIKRGAFTIIEVELDKADFSPAMQRFSKLVKKTAM